MKVTLIKHKEDGLKRSTKGLFKVRRYLHILISFSSNKALRERLEKGWGFYWFTNWRLNKISRVKIFHENNKELSRWRSWSLRSLRGPMPNFFRIGDIQKNNRFLRKWGFRYSNFYHKSILIEEIESWKREKYDVYSFRSQNANAII